MHLIRKPRRVLVGVVGCLCAVSLAGCGSSSGSGPTTGAVPKVSVVGNPSATCRQFTAAVVQPLLAHTLTKATVVAAGTDGSGERCTYSVAGVSNALSIVVIAGPDAPTKYTSQEATLGQAVTVPGVGDQASRDAGDKTAEIIAIKGTVYCAVTPQISEVPGVAALETAAGGSPKIGDPAYAVIATAAGTLCNRVFGNGNTKPDLSALTSPAK